MMANITSSFDNEISKEVYPHIIRRRVTPMFFWIRLDGLVTRVGKPVELESQPKSARVRFTYNEKTLQWRIFYGLNGDEPVTELAESKEGIFWSTPTSESLAAYVMMSQGNCDLDHFEIRRTE